MSRCGSTGQRWQQGEGSRAIQRGTGWVESNDWAGRDSWQPAQERQGVQAGNRAQAAEHDGSWTEPIEEARRDGQARRLVAMRDGQGVDQGGQDAMGRATIKPEGQGATEGKTWRGQGAGPK